jgi:hypothetical protein
MLEGESALEKKGKHMDRVSEMNKRCSGYISLSWEYLYKTTFLLVVPGIALRALHLGQVLYYVSHSLSPFTFVFQIRSHTFAWPSLPSE